MNKHTFLFCMIVVWLGAGPTLLANSKNKVELTLTQKAFLAHESLKIFQKQEQDIMEQKRASEYGPEASDVIAPLIPVAIGVGSKLLLSQNRMDLEKKVTSMKVHDLDKENLAKFNEKRKEINKVKAEIADAVSAREKVKAFEADNALKRARIQSINGKEGSKAEISKLMAEIKNDQKRIDDWNTKQAKHGKLLKKHNLFASSINDIAGFNLKIEDAEVRYDKFLTEEYKPQVKKNNFLGKLAKFGIVGATVIGVGNIGYSIFSDEGKTAVETIRDIFKDTLGISDFGDATLSSYYASEEGAQLFLSLGTEEAASYIEKNDELAKKILTVYHSFLQSKCAEGLILNCLITLSTNGSEKEIKQSLNLIKNFVDSNPKSISLFTEKHSTALMVAVDFGLDASIIESLFKANPEMLYALNIHGLSALDYLISDNEHYDIFQQRDILIRMLASFPRIQKLLIHYKIGNERAVKLFHEELRLKNEARGFDEELASLCALLENNNISDIQDVLEKVGSHSEFSKLLKACKTKDSAKTMINDLIDPKSIDDLEEFKTVDLVGASLQ